jgi:hypothetical protein
MIADAYGSVRVRCDPRKPGWLIDVNDHEHYRIPGAVISGG